MGGFSLWHILIFAIIVLLLFGGNRFSTMMKDVAKGLRGFKEGLSEDEAERRPEQRQQQQLPPQPAQPIDVTPRSADPVTPPPATGDDSSR